MARGLQSGQELVTALGCTLSHARDLLSGRSEWRLGELLALFDAHTDLPVRATMNLLHARNLSPVDLRSLGKRTSRPPRFSEGKGRLVST